MKPKQTGTMTIFVALAKRYRRKHPNDSKGQGGRSRKAQSLLFDDDGDGVFICTESSSITTPPCSNGTMSSSDSSATSSLKIASVLSWKSSGSAEHQMGSPLVASDPDRYDAEPIVDEVTRLTTIMRRSRELPGTWYYSSNHVLVNQERKNRTIAPLIRMRELDEFARSHAEKMAVDNIMIHISPSVVTAALKDKTCRRLGSNVAKGQTIREIHENMMQFKQSHKNNIIDRRFINFGMGTAVGAEGDLYLCQIFRG
jgi:hypothetical protein